MTFQRRRWVCRIVACAAAAACACDTPVYEYARTQWPADEYELIVFHCGGAGAAVTLASLRAAAGTTANIVVRESDLERDRRYEELLAECPATSLPWLIVRYPARADPSAATWPAPVPTRRTAWAGPVETNSADTWLTSPLRRETVRLLLAGRAAVWIFLESGRREEDEAAHKRLTAELARLERTLPLPASADGGPAAGGVAFAVVRVSRADPRERALTVMLSGSEPDLAARAGEPMAFPVYGRGRVLYALVGAGINEAMIAKAAEFLTGECSCEAKSENPGLELLLSADWGDASAPGGGIADFLARADTGPAGGGTGTTPAAGGAVAAESSHAGRPRIRWFLGLGALMLLAAGSGRALARRRRRDEEQR